MGPLSSAPKIVPGLFQPGGGRSTLYAHVTEGKMKRTVRWDGGGEALSTQENRTS